MIVFIGYALIALIVAGLLFYAVLALLPDGLGVKPEADRRPFVLPDDRRMTPTDLDRVRIPVALRGYRFAETDDLIDRLTAEIVVRDEEIARLRKLDVAQVGGPYRPRPEAATRGFAVSDYPTDGSEPADSVALPDDTGGETHRTDG